MIDLDDEQALMVGDPGGMLATVGELPTHCRDGHERGLAAEHLPSANGVTALTFCGMGSSAVAGEVVRALYRARLGVPVDVHRSAALPEYCGPRTLVVASSYSGNTAETLSCFREALGRGCRAIAVSSGGKLAAEASAVGLAAVSVPGGLMPRAAIGYMTLASLGALEAVGLVPRLTADVEETVSELRSIVANLGPSIPRAENPAKDLAWRIEDRTPVIWGAEGLAAVAAARWKTQFNENAKVPSWASSLPELDHNEVVGWTRPAGESCFLVALRHEGEDPDASVRFAPSMRIAEEAGAVVEEVWAAGRSPLARLLSLVAMGDFTSVFHGLAHGIDPSPIAAITRLKEALGEEASR